MAISPNQPTLFLLNDTLTNSPVTFTAASIAKYYPGTNGSNDAVIVCSSEYIFAVSD